VREPLPREPGRLVVCTLLGRARRARGCVTTGDDRLETRAYAVKRYLFRLGHAARSARYATSIEQLGEHSSQLVVERAGGLGSSSGESGSVTFISENFGAKVHRH
jgi:hypothetical protein